MSQAAAGQPKKKILIVDDAGPVVVLCVNVLQALGYAVRGANSGDAAIQILRQEPFDLIVLDYKMLGMTGFDVFREARALHPNVAVVMVTGHGTPAVMEQAIRMGVTSILLKPFTSDELRAAVGKALAAPTPTP